jgi:hypothetical protein
VLREPVAWSMAWPTAGGSGTRTTLPRTCKTRWPCSSPRSAMSLPVASKTCKPSMATSAKPYGLGDWRTAASRPRTADAWARGLVIRRARQDGGRAQRANAEDAVKHAGAVEPGRDLEPPRHGEGLNRRISRIHRMHSSRCGRLAASGSIPRSAHQARQQSRSDSRPRGRSP